MRFVLLFITLFIISTKVCNAQDWVDYFQDNDMKLYSNQAVIYNALGLSNKQRVETIEEHVELKKVLTRKQRKKYSMITRLERQARRRPINSENFYKTNPLLRPFGDPNIAKKCK